MDTDRKLYSVMIMGSGVNLSVTANVRMCMDFECLKCSTNNILYDNICVDFKLRVGYYGIWGLMIWLKVVK